MIRELVVGRVIKVESFNFISKSGGTGFSTGVLADVEFSGVAEVKVINRWEDYETGERGWAVPVSSDVTEYLKKYAMPGKPNLERFKPGHHDEPATDGSDVYIVFISEFDIAGE